LSLVVRRGEFIALLGASGCGKSTALNCIAGLLTLSSGSIWLDKRRIDLLPPEKRGFGMVFQNYALFPHMNVRNNVGFGLVMRDVPPEEVDVRVEHALALVQLEGQGDKLPGQLSGGQQQRVAIARAIVVEPPLVLMDEPLSNLDAKLRIETRAEIRRIHRELGRTTIYVTHDQDEALSLADRIVVLRDGLVQQVAAPHDVYTQPANLHVARFMGYRNVIEFESGGMAADGRMQLRRDGMTLVGTAREPPRTGHVLAAIRPDDFIFGAAPDGNSVPGIVANVEYCGRDSLIDVSVSGGVRLHVRTSSPVAPGDRLILSVSPDRVLVYPAEA
ncbi:MAG TPA: ABC transporter ATP-binding protein, partial [Candidatus Limnocylindria bacterium]|nr:ABC transporter ATP-binding protein [Candidatus Limnocylindria bacterium]